MRNALMTFTVTLALISSAACAKGLFTAGDEFAPFEEERFTVSKGDLNAPVSPYKVYFYVQTSEHQAERRLDLIVTIGRPSTWFSKTNKQLPGQIKPYIAFWQIRDSSGVVHRQWEPHFENRTRSGPGDDFYTTIFSLPESELKQSHLLLYFEDVDGDRERDDVTFDLDMTGFDWSSTGNPRAWRYKPVVQGGGKAKGKAEEDDGGQRGNTRR